MSGSQDLEQFMDAVLRRLDALGIAWDYWSNETAPGQVEINLAPSPPVECADNVTRTKQALRDVAAEQGRSVTFMAWGIDRHLGGGMHVNLSLSRDGPNAFHGDGADGPGTELLRRWVAGLVATLPAAMSFLTPNVNSYRRLIEITGPPDDRELGGGQQVGRGADDHARAALEPDRAPGAVRGLQRLSGARGDPCRWHGGDRGRARGRRPSSRAWPGRCRRTRSPGFRPR